MTKNLLTIILTVWSLIASAQINLIKDINTKDDRSDPRGFVSIDLSGYYFSADDGVNGRELWKTNATAAGTVLIKDINPGLGDGIGYELFAYNASTIFFAGNNGSNGSELWKTDGTQSGTVMVKDIYSGSNASDPHDFILFNGFVFFSANDGINGSELWKTDGTSAGTVMVIDFEPGATGSNPYHFIKTSTKLFFVANVGGSFSLCATSGTALTTLTLNSSTSPYTNMSLIFDTLGGNVFFTAGNSTYGHEIWKSNGTVAGTNMIKDILVGSGSGAFGFTGITMGGFVYFQGENSFGRELFRTDGTIAGTNIVKDLTPGSGDSDPFGFEYMGGSIYFFANSSELWKCSGSGATTVLVKDINTTIGLTPASTNYIIGSLSATNQLYFYGNNGSTGRELWKSDGTTLGTQLVKDINTGTQSAFQQIPQKFINYFSNSLFVADDGATGAEIWKSDGTSAGTVLVKNINTAVLGSDPFYLKKLGNQLIFNADDGKHGNHLWRSDGISTGTVLIKQIADDYRYFNLPTGLVEMNNEIYFAFQDGPIIASSVASHLWKTDGTAGNTIKVYDFNGSATSSGLINVNLEYESYANNGTIYFAADSLPTINRELWKTNGNAGGTSFIKDINSIPNIGSNPRQFINYNSNTYFTCSSNTGFKLYKTDGTSGGTIPLIANNIGTSNFKNAITVYNNKIYFMAYDATNGYELWQSDGTSGGSMMLVDINPGTAGSTISGFTIFKNKLYFFAETASSGLELWVTDGIAGGTALVKDINPGAADGITMFQSPPVLSGGYMYFAGNDGINGMELWRTDGTAIGTIMVKNISVSSSSALDISSEMIDANGYLFFVADNGVNGKELWRSNGTAVGTFLWQDLYIGSIGSDPQQLTFLNGNVYFSAVRPDVGRELFGTSFSPLPVQFMTFKATEMDNEKVICKWSTASETNNDFFTVERSKNGIDFETIGLVHGSGTSSSIHNYSFVDVHPYIGISYYRIKQTDINGAFSFTKTESVKIKIEENIIIYPNPASDKVSFDMSDDKDHRVIIYNVQGIIMSESSISKTKKSINTCAFVNGVYSISVQSGDSFKKEKLVINH